jgi:CBS domain-containing protein
MFSVYGKAGRVFRGSMEELRKIGPIAALGRASRVAPVGTPMGSAQQGPVSQGADLAHRDAMAAYAQNTQNQPQRHPLTRVRDIMNTEVLAVPEDATVAEAWDLLRERQMGQAPVVNNQGILVGLLTRADLMRSDRLPGPNDHALVWRALQMQSVGELMLTPVPSVAPDTDIRRLARILLDTGLPGLPVVEDQGLVLAFVSRTDILRAVVADPPLDLWT